MSKVKKNSKNLAVAQESTIFNPDVGSYRKFLRKPKNPVGVLGEQKLKPPLTPFEQGLTKIVSKYEDVVFCQRNFTNQESLRRVYCLHIARHIRHCKQIWKENDQKLEKMPNQTPGADKSGEFKDRGIHRASALILLPTRNSCLQVIQSFHSLLNWRAAKNKNNEISISNHKRFLDEFGDRNGEDDEEFDSEEEPFEMNDEEIIGSSKVLSNDNNEEDDEPATATTINDEGPAPHRRNLKRKKKGTKKGNEKFKRIKKVTTKEEKKNAKPKDFEDWFGGNTHDNFRLGVCLTKKGIVLYTPFDKSDLIIASPLGLKFILDGQDDGLKNLSFLSSIEMVVLDSVEFLLMQNWLHVLQVMEQVNQLPEKITNVPLMRVKSHILKNQAALYRQLLLFSAVEHPLLHNFICRFATNQQADLCYFPFLISLLEQPDCLQGRQPKLRVKFISILTSSTEQAIESLMTHRSTAPSQETIAHWDPLYLSALRRFTTFEKQVLPRLTKGSHPGVFIYVPNYFDLVRLRLLLQKHSLDFVTISEYTSAKERDRRFTLFEQARVRIVLFSERLHFFLRRRKIHGIENVIFYAPPTIPVFWKEIVNMIKIKETSTAINDNHFLILLFHPTIEAPQLTAFLGVEFLRRLAWEPVEDN